MAHTLRVYKVFTKTGQGPWLRETLPWACRCNKLHSTICTVLPSAFVSWKAWLHNGDAITPLPQWGTPPGSGRDFTTLAAILTRPESLLSPHSLWKPRLGEVPSLAPGHAAWAPGQEAQERSPSLSPDRLPLAAPGSVPGFVVKALGLSLPCLPGLACRPRLVPPPYQAQTPTAAHQPPPGPCSRGC